MAYTAEEIQDKIQAIVRLGKPYWTKYGQQSNGVVYGRDDMPELPEYWDGYRVAVDQYERIRVHAEHGVFPERLLKLRSPNEEEREQQYRRNNYKQTTLPVFKDFDSTVQRIFHDSNWNISYKQEDDAFVRNNITYRDYVEKQIHTYGSIENFVKFILTTQKLKDANGVIAVKPRKIPTILRGDEEVVDSTKLVEPIPVYYNIVQVLGYEEEDHCIVELSEKSMVFDGNTEKKTGKVFEFYDNENIWRITQTGRRIDYTFTYELYFNHNSGEMPVHKLMGVPTVYDGKIMWQSPFLYAVDNLDLVVLDESNLLLSKSSCVYPYKIMLGVICEFEDNSQQKCLDGMIWSNEMGKHYSCPSCNGSGLKSRMSPLGMMLLKPKTRDDEGDVTMNQDPLKYVSPDLSSLKFLREEAREHEMRARQILHLKASDSKATFNVDNPTATGSNNDLKALYAFLKPISDQCFNIYEWVLNMVGKQRYGDKFESPVLQYPQTFDFKTTEDYLEEINGAIKVGMPVFVVHTLIHKFLQSVYFSEEQVSRTFNLITAADRLLSFSTEEIALMIGRGTAARWEEILHNSAVQLIDELLLENEDFFNQDLTVQIEQLVTKAKEKAGEIAPPTSTQNIVDAIIGS
jgi:hypothetical protein